MTTFVLPFVSPDATLAVVGGKGANLSRMTRAGFPVPPGFLITTAAYRAFVQANDLRARIVALATNKTKTVEEVSAAIRRLFEQGHIQSETADIAAEYKGCRHMHLFEDLVVVEVVDEHHQPVPPGTYGAKLLVTTLFSRTQPLIRYELNDSVRLATDTCPSGLPFAMLESIQGRVEDALLLPAKSGGRMAIQPLVFNRVMDILPVSGWQIVQEADDSLTVLLSGARDGLVDAALVDSLRQALTAQDVHVSSIQVQRVSAIPKTTSGKTPLIKAYRPS